MSQAVRRIVKQIRQRLGGPWAKAIRRGALKLKLYQWLQTHVKVPSPIRLLDFDVHYIHIGNLALLYEEIFDQQNYYFKAQNDAPRILDCGSNIGVSILFFKYLYPKAQITGFEASEGAFQVLCQNIETNQFQGVDVYHKMLAGHVGEQVFYVSPENPGALSNSAFQERMAGVPQQVKTTSLSPFVQGPVDFLKMDIEGAELEVIKELAASNKLGLIRQMIVEYHHHLQPEKDELATLLGLLEAHGFGYQIRHGAGNGFGRPPRREAFQDLLIYAYQKAS